MKLTFRHYFAVCYLLYPAIFVAKYFEVAWAEKIFVPFFVILVLAFNVYINPIKKGKNRFLLYAFLFVCVGDIIINLISFNEWSVLSFVLTHVNLILFFSFKHRWSRADLKYIIPVALLSLGIFLSFRPNIPTSKEAFLFGCYLLVLSTMLWRATSFLSTRELAITKFLIVVGALLFYLTDVFVSTNVVFDSSILLALTWICYPPALFMLSLMNYPFKSKVYKERPVSVAAAEGAES